MSSLTRVFVSKNDITDNKVAIKGSDALHLTKVMRLKAGDELEVCDMQKREYKGEIISVSKDEVIVRLSDMKESDTELPYRITVYQALVKGDKFDQVIQKSVELGAYEIIPVICERCIAKADKNSSKTERYNKIAQSAASQCGRGIVPLVREPVSFDTAANELAKLNGDGGCGFLCYEGDGTVFISDFLKNKRERTEYSFLIGPEGGISAREVEYAIANGIPMIGLGKRILRTETAPLFVISALNVLIL